MIFTTLAVLALFTQAIIAARAEPVSPDSGTNLLVTSVMVLILIILASFSTLTTSIDGEYLRVKFGFGLFKKKFPLKEIATVTSVKNRWYYGYGIRFWFWPKMWIYNVSGFDAVELTMKNGKIYRIGTDVPKELETAIKFSLSKI